MIVCTYSTTNRIRRVGVRVKRKGEGGKRKEEKGRREKEGGRGSEVCVCAGMGASCHQQHHVISMKRVE